MQIVPSFDVLEQIEPGLRLRTVDTSSDPFTLQRGEEALRQDQLQLTKTL